MVYAHTFVCVREGQVQLRSLEELICRLSSRHYVNETTRLNISSNLRILVYPAFSGISCTERLVKSNHDSTEAELNWVKINSRTFLQIVSSVEHAQWELMVKMGHWIANQLVCVTVCLKFLKIFSYFLVSSFCRFFLTFMRLFLLSILKPFTSDCLLKILLSWTWADLPGQIVYHG